jgi:hypothetical protein
VGATTNIVVAAASPKSRFRRCINQCGHSHRQHRHSSCLSQSQFCSYH